MPSLLLGLSFCGEAASVTWETLDRSGNYCVHTASQRGRKAWLPGTSAVIGTDPLIFFKASFCHLISYSRVALCLAVGSITLFHVHSHLWVLSFNICIGNLVLDGGA